MYLSIIGNIGAGKTTLLPKLKRKFPNSKIIEEPLKNLQDNGMLKNLYEKPSIYALRFQVGMLNGRLGRLKQLNIKSMDIIEDGNYMIDGLIFAKMYNTFHHRIYKRLYNKINSLYKDKTVLFVYLDVDVGKCLRNIRERKRPFEQISREMLVKIDKMLKEFLLTHKHIIYDPYSSIDELIKEIKKYNFR